MAKRALITGAAGLVGANLARVLLADGACAVRGLVRATTDLRALAGLDVELVRGDVRDPEALERAITGCDVVYHCAAVYQLGRQGAASDAEIIDTAVRGATNTLEAAARAGSVERVVLTSSVVAVGRSHAAHVSCDESWTWNLDGAYAYIVAKRRAEEAALALAAARGLTLVVVNPSGVLGPWDTRPTPTAASVLTLLNARVPVPFYPAGGGNMVDAEDVARGHLLAARHGRAGERYILCGENATYRTILGTVARFAGQAAPRLPLGPRVAWGLGAVMEAVSKLTGRPPELTRELAEQHVGLYQYYTPAKAARELGYAPRGLAAVLARAILWFVRDGKLRRPEKLDREALEMAAAAAPGARPTALSGGAYEPS
jgi:dihydroflavonol-4-reductase